MIKALIIDDEPLARSIVKEYLQEIPGIELVAECGDGFEGIKSINQLQPHLIFLDVQMPKINGFEMLELLDPKPAVIFTTAFDEYAIKAFENHAVDYLLKPFSKDRFDKALEKFYLSAPVQKKNTEVMLATSTQLPSHAERVVVKTGGRIRIIPVHDIHFLEAADDYVKIHTAEGHYLKNKTMTFFEECLPPDQFVRTHRSYMVNIHQITRIDPYEKENHIAILLSGEKIPVSRSGYGKLKQVLGL
ncbi:MAG: LytR/AlgR family response regulator transcription factor [Flavisolibacter sp.]